MGPSEQNSWGMDVYERKERYTDPGRRGKARKADKREWERRIKGRNKIHTCRVKEACATRSLDIQLETNFKKSSNGKQPHHKARNDRGSGT